MRGRSYYTFWWRRWWQLSSSNASAVVTDSIVHGAAAGSDTIAYTLSNACGSATSLKIVNIIALPFAGTVSGDGSVCEGATVTFTSPVSGGAWSGSGTSAIVHADGSITGIAEGSIIITYNVANACGSDTATKPIVVNPLPVSGIILGIDSICQGSVTTLTSSVPGGEWSSINPAITIVSGAGIIGGIAPGTDTVVYTVINACGTAIAKKTVTVLPLARCNPLSVQGHGGFITPGLLTVAPNPNNGSFTVRLESLTGEDLKLELYDVLGKQVAVFAGHTNEDISIRTSVAAGLYFIGVKTANGSYKTKVVVN